MKNKVKIILYATAFVMLIIGICIFSYPLISAQISENYCKQEIENFYNYREHNFENQNDTEKDSKSQNLNPEHRNKISAVYNENLSELYRVMSSYNQKIFKNHQSGLRDAWSYEQSSVDLTAFGLNNTPVGVLRIPAMNNLEMPLYLGASYNNMSHGAAQLGETSMPIGGKNTNCVIAGHRGWNGASYFLNIESLRVGDRVYIDNLWETLEYSVSEIKIINPNDIDAVKIQNGKDMLTLITCHPYWASTYRYAVFCTRVNKDKSENKDDTEPHSKTQDTLQSTSQTENHSYANNSNVKFESSESRIKAEQLSYFLIPLILIILALILLCTNHRKNNR